MRRPPAALMSLFARHFKAFDGDKGDLRFFVSGSNTTLQADIDGDKKADFTVKLIGEHALAASDILL